MYTLTERRKIAQEISIAIRQNCNPNGILLVGKDAHSPSAIDSNTDMDIMIVSRVPESLAKANLVDERLVEKLPRGFDNYCFRSSQNGIDISLHVLTPEAFEDSTSGIAGYLRSFRQHPKKESYYSLLNFGGQEYRFPIRNSPVDGGFELYVPFGTIVEGTLHIGVPKDKLLSKPILLYEKEKSITDSIDELWKTTVKRLSKECKSHAPSVLNALYRKNTFSKETRDFVISKAEEFAS